MSIDRIDQNPGRGSGSSCRASWNPAAVTSGRGEPEDHSHTQDPRRRSRQRRDQTGDDDDQRHVAQAKGPDGHPPISIALELRRLVDRGECRGSHCSPPERAWRPEGMRRCSGEHVEAISSSVNAAPPALALGRLRDRHGRRDARDRGIRLHPLGVATFSERCHLSVDSPSCFLRDATLALSI